MIDIKAIVLDNCYNLIEGTDAWKETGKVVLKRWIMPQAIIDLEEEEHDGCKHYSVTVEYSARHYDWSAQKMRFGSDMDGALVKAKDLAETIENWPIFGGRR